MIAGVWILSMVVSLPPLAGWKRAQPVVDGFAQCVLSEEPGYVIDVQTGYVIYVQAGYVIDVQTGYVIDVQTDYVIDVQTCLLYTSPSPRD